MVVETRKLDSCITLEHWKVESLCTITSYQDVGRPGMDGDPEQLGLHQEQEAALLAPGPDRACPTLFLQPARAQPYSSMH